MRGVGIDVGLDRLAGYAREHGHANPPVRTVWLDWQIGIWLRDLRKKKRENKLTTEQIIRAEDLGVDWNPPVGRRRNPPRPTREQRREAQLHASLDRLLPYWHEHGNLDIRQIAGTDDWPQAGRFICRLRALRREQRLPRSVEERAIEMGVVWEPMIGRRARH